MKNPEGHNHGPGHLDTAQMKVTNNPKANALVDLPYRTSYAT
jgi:hypothetical protein